MKKLSIILISICLSMSIYAGDVANFMNLGFSADGKYFLFGEYGIVADYQKAYSNMWLVDVERNAFVSGGVFSGEYKTVIEPGESSIGALLKLLKEGDKKISAYKIDHLEQGRPLYVRINEKDNVDLLKFRDFINGLSYEFEMVKNLRTEGSVNYSSFGVNLKTTDKNGKTRSYKMGNPGYERKGISDYRIERILHSSTGDNVVVVIAKYVDDKETTNIRYMVETLSLN